MTEAMSRREIEDILTSIRKLVSHDPATLGAPTSAAHDTAPVGKLVLTSALRVADDPAPAPADMTDRAPLPEQKARFFAKPAAPEVPAITTDAPDVAPDHSVLEPTDEGTAASLLARISRSASHSAPDPEHDARMANPAGNIDAAPEMAPPPIADVQDWLDDADIPVPADPAEGDTLFDHPNRFAHSVSDREADGLTGPDADSLEETLARLEAALSGTHAAAQTEPAPQPVATPSADRAQAAPNEPDSGDTAMIDEAMLYQLVANIVRQELQGELGEKITRAIRKLVRSEVARELQLRNL